MWIVSMAIILAAPCQSAEPSQTIEQVKKRILEVRSKAGKSDISKIDDIEVYLLAHERLRVENGKNAPALRKAMVDEASERLDHMSGGRAPWQDAEGGWSCVAYRSRVDDSLQPCAIFLPSGYHLSGKKWPVDVVLHGRSDGMTHASFLAAHSKTRKPSRVDRVVLEVFGRGNVAYRWAGETDVFEAMEALWSRETAKGRVKLLDPDRVVLKGFSMGGAGTWHLGLHHPDRWTAIQPGAGFTNTIGYAKTLPENLPAWQSRILTLYDAQASSANACMVPVVAYSGGDDPQIDAARRIEQALKGWTGNPPLRFAHIVAPGLGHKMPPEWEAKVGEALAPHVAAGRREPDHIRFLTHSVRHGKCYWVEVLGLENHYAPSTIEAKRNDAAGEGLVVSTKGITALRLSLGGAKPGPVVKLTINGQLVEASVRGDSKGSGMVELAKSGETWSDGIAARKFIASMRKKPGLQGPIDDAFMERFICVIGTGKPRNPIAHDLAMSRLQSFRDQWRTYLHGEVIVRKDTELSQRERGEANLILFGDPSANKVLADILPRLPLKYVGNDFVMGDARYNSAAHLPVLIHPNPYNPGRYVVINSGHTFGQSELRGTNALLFPRLGDWAVLRAGTEGGEVVQAGFFDEDWSWPKSPR